MNKSFTVHDLPIYERPRERLIKFGVEAMSIQELMAVILGRGVKGESVIDIVHNLLKKFGNLKRMSEASMTELEDITGIGQAKATQILATFELARRMEQETTNNSKNIIIKCPENVLEIVQKYLKGKKKEHFLILSLDTRNRMIDCHVISMGSLDSSIVHPREVFHPAIIDHAASIILIHNHPSGNPEPSEDDIKLTKQLIDSGKMLGIDILDHIIFSDRTYLSMKDKNII